MKKLSLFALLLLSTSLLIGQSKDVPSKPLSETSLKWIAPVRISMFDGENAKTPSFEGADHNAKDRFLPRYTQRIELKSNENDFSASINSPVFEPLSDAEAALISSKSPISTEITITTNVFTSKKKPYGMLSFIPIRKNALSGKYEKLVGFTITTNAFNKPKAAGSRSHVYATTSVLQSGDWYKISTSANGVYKLSYDFFKNMGIDMTTINPQNLRFFGNGGGMLSEDNVVARQDDLVENAIVVAGESDGSFDENDYVLFYGTGANRWLYNAASCPTFYHQTNLYSDSAYYFFTFDLGVGKRITNQGSSGLTPTHTITSFDDYAFTETENTNFIKSGRDWWGEYFDNISTYSFSYSFPNIDMSAAATVRARIASRFINPAGCNYNVSCQTGSAVVFVPGITGSSYDDYANIEEGCFSFTPNSPSTAITVTKQSPAAVGWMDYVEINVRRQLTMAGNQLSFRDAQSLGTGNVAHYDLSSPTTVEIWDVTDIYNVKRQNMTVSGTSHQFTLPSDSLHEFVAFNGNSFNIPVASGKVENQNLHAMSNKDMIIVAHPDFYDEAMQLAAFHESFDSLTTVVVTPQQIFNEYSSGAQDICAIRDFAKMFYDRASVSTELPQYLLLFGDGSYDNKKRFSNNTNFIPTYQSYNSTVPTSSYVSDDFFGLLDDNEGYWAESDNDAVDLGIGRFPVKTKAEAQAALNKIFLYNRNGLPSTANTTNSSCATTSDSPYGDWRNSLCFIADDEDNNLHLNQSDSLARKTARLNKTYNVDKIFLDAYPQESTPGGNRYPDVTKAIAAKLDKGALIINYTGHGGEVGLAHERIIEVSDINGWKNIDRLPLFFTATCEFSRFDDPERTSAGEYVFLNPNGGGLALLTTVRLVFASPNFGLNLNFYNAAFTPVGGRMPRIGDLYVHIKNQVGGNSVNSRNFTLLGDPAVRLTYPRYNISTDTVNSVPVTTSSSDTIKALSMVHISGYVRDKSGAIMTDYNGVLYPTVFDKSQTVSTLSNDGSVESPVTSFKIQKNILYRGKVSVTNGFYQYSFVVPRDIAYQYGVGRISVYAENGSDDATGYYEKIIIGGANDSAVADNAGPEIKLYVNDNRFVYGGLTDENPDLYATLKDDNGINTVGNGIGHDVVAVLDANTDEAIVLNDYYQADLNSYKSGSVRYPFSELSEGKHTLELKVWDVYNNSSKSYTEFVVAKSAELALSHVLNYPNPFTTKTSFFFEQNQCCQSLEVELQIFTVSGKLVKSFSDFVYTEGYRSAPIDWDGRDDFGDKIGKGVYVYRLKVKTSDGHTAEKYEKLVILN